MSSLCPLNLVAEIGGRAVLVIMAERADDGTLLFHYLQPGSSQTAEAVAVAVSFRVVARAASDWPRVLPPAAPAP